MTLLGISRLLFVSVLCATTCLGSQMIVTMKSGERLIGEASEKSNNATLVLNSALLGELRLPTERILMREAFTSDAAEQSTKSKAAAQTPENMEMGSPLQLSEEEMADVKKESLLDRLVDLKAPKSWSGDLRFGLDFGGGDSKWRQLYSKGNLVIDPKQDPNYYRITGSYTYRTIDRNGESVKATDRYDGNFTYRRDFGERFFFQNTLAGRVDEIKGINYEIQELLGVGIRLQPLDTIDIYFGGGGGVEDFNPDFDDTRSGINAVANFFQELTWRPFEKATLSQEFNYFVSPSQSERFNYVLTTSFRYRLTDLLGFEISFNQNYDNDVGAGNVRDVSQWRNAIIVYF